MIEIVWSFLLTLLDGTVTFLSHWLSIYAGQDQQAIDSIVRGVMVLFFVLAVFKAIPSKIFKAITPETPLLVVVLIFLTCAGSWYEFNINQGSQEALAYFLPFSRDQLRLPSMIPSMCQWAASTVFIRTKDKRVRRFLYVTVAVDTLLTFFGFGLTAGLKPTELIRSSRAIPFGLSASFFNVVVEELWILTAYEMRVILLGKKGI